MWCLFGAGCPKVSCRRAEQPASFVTTGAEHTHSPCSASPALNQATVRSVPEKAGKDRADIITKAPVEGCVCWQQHSGVAHVWKCRE